MARNSFPPVNSGETALSRWLAENGVSRKRFCDEHSLDYKTLSGLAEPRIYRFVASLPAVMRVAEITGLTVEEIMADVRRVQEAA